VPERAVWGLLPPDIPDLEDPAERGSGGIPLGGGGCGVSLASPASWRGGSAIARIPVALATRETAVPGREERAVLAVLGL